MNLLILGRSSIVMRRALPALPNVSAVEAIDIASRRPFTEPIPGANIRSLYVGYEDALARSDASLVYVSLVNSAHAAWVRAALEAGKHVVVDKPAFIDPRDLMDLQELAAANNLCLAEATVFADHPQVAAIKALMQENGGVTRVSALFSIPPLPDDNFRYDPALGGGSLLDMAPYAAATGRLFFDGDPLTVTCHILTRHHKTGVDTAFSVLATYPDGCCLVGQFGFDTEYQNQVTAIGPGAAATIDRFFTTPPDSENTISVVARNQKSVQTATAGDSFALFFDRLCQAIDRRDWTSFTQSMERDGRFVQAMRVDAEKDAL